MSSQLLTEVAASSRQRGCLVLSCCKIKRQRKFCFPYSFIVLIIHNVIVLIRRGRGQQRYWCCYKSVRDTKEMEWMREKDQCPEWVANNNFNLWRVWFSKILAFHSSRFLFAPFGGNFSLSTSSSIASTTCILKKSLNGLQVETVERKKGRRPFDRCRQIRKPFRRHDFNQIQAPISPLHRIILEPAEGASWYAFKFSFHVAWHWEQLVARLEPIKSFFSIHFIWEIFNYVKPDHKPLSEKNFCGVGLLACWLAGEEWKRMWKEIPQNLRKLREKYFGVVLSSKR